MDVVVSPEARSDAPGRGGIVYVRSHSPRCCAGPLTLLDTTTETPSDSVVFVELPAGDLMVSAAVIQRPAPIPRPLRGGG